VTGITTISTELGAKRLDLLCELAPRATTIGYFAASRDEKPQETSSILAAARHLRREVVILQVRNTSEVEAAFAVIEQRNIGALIVGDFTVVAINRERILELTAQYKIPAIYPSTGYVSRGGLVSYSADLSGPWRQMGALYVGPILKGARAADLPFQQPTKFKLMLNLKTAKALGLAVPETLLATADEVIQ
jgi:putative tryptophan/tyrosine transport system substrate-binding protein